VEAKKVRMFTIILLSSLITFASCDPDMPKIPRKPQIWPGVPEKVSICRKVGDKVECLSTADPKFAKFECTPIDDGAMVRQYIKVLATSCEKWKPVNEVQASIASELSLESLVFLVQ